MHTHHITASIIAILSLLIIFSAIQLVITTIQNTPPPVHTVIVPEIIYQPTTIYLPTVVTVTIPPPIDLPTTGGH